MFDPKQLLEALVNGASQSGRSQEPQKPVSNDISDLLRQFTEGGPSSASSSQQSPGSARSGGGLSDLLSELQRRAGSAGETAGDVFGQATDGVREGAGKIGKASGLDDLIGQMSGGRSPQELVEQVQNYMQNNKLQTGAILGGLGALILGTQTGRSLASGAAKAGALALIGGLAYKAYQNYSAGRPLITDRSESFEPAPLVSGFGDTSISNETAMACIRAMIAAAAADGRLDANEQQRIVGSLKDQGLDASAEEFLANELNKPSSIDRIAAGSRSEQEDIQLYTAARVAIEVDTPAEKQFLGELANQLQLPGDLVAHINASARQVAN
ncbi:MAG: tellurite resistance TerB family protein [Hyphomicrobiaceae bacterium TMED74]|nr:protein YebE [Filomicrobium sp.]RPG47899.1 MAG: tellurite resistance TerB family protein [Hyphomicrobiaceae bacterium TMED74]